MAGFDRSDNQARTLPVVGPGGPVLARVAGLRIALVAAVRLYREGLATELGAQAGYVVVAVSGSAESAITAIALTQPDVVLIDIAMPDVRELVAAVRDAHPAARILAFAVGECERDIDVCAEAGVAAFVTPDVTVCELVAAINACMRDELSCSPRAAALLLRRCSMLAVASLVTASVSAPNAPRVAALTAREREIATLMVEGRSNKQIGRTLNIALATVKNHIHNILRKLDVASRADAARCMRATALHY